MKKIITIPLLVVCLVMILSSCGGNEPPTTSVGTYTSDKFSATITKDTIEVNIVDKDTKSLYWLGTWTDEKSSVSSTGDREALDASLFGSGSDDKEFTIDGNMLKFELQMMGSTTDVSLEKE